MHGERATILLESVRALRAEGKEYLRRKKGSVFPVSRLPRCTHVLQHDDELRSRAVSEGLRYLSLIVQRKRLRLLLPSSSQAEAVPEIDGQTDGA